MGLLLIGKLVLKKLWGLIVHHIIKMFLLDCKNVRDLILHSELDRIRLVYYFIILKQQRVFKTYF
jgi:hypothetical protein